MDVIKVINRFNRILGAICAIFLMSSYSAKGGLLNKGGFSYQHSTSFSESVNLYRLQYGEEFVYGKIGLKPDGNFNYSLVIIRKPNTDKVIYAREFEPYGSRPIQGGGKMRLDENPKDYDKYDFWLIFNGQKFGPYDRIVEMHQNKSNTDSWVSRDGQRISFAGVRGQKYEPIIGNSKEISFWNSFQAPIFDPLSGINTYAYLWNNDNYRLYENGNAVLTDWKSLHKVSYSEDGRNLIYVGAKENKNAQFVYLNHSVIAGPYYIVSQAGFIPGTNLVYYSGFQERITDNSVNYDYEYVAIGSKRIIIPDGYGVGNFHFTDSKVSFSVTSYNKAYKGNDPYKRDRIMVYEYNYRTGETVEHDGYALTINTNVVGNTFYYNTYNSNGDAVLAMEGGVMLDKVSRAELGVNGTAFFKVSPSGSLYTYYNSGYSTPFKIRKDGQPYVLAGQKIAWVDNISYNPLTNEDNIVLNVDASVGSKHRKLLKGNREFELLGDTQASDIYFALSSNNFYSIHRTINPQNDWKYQLYKNGKSVDSRQWTSIASFCMSNNGEQYAMLVSDSNAKWLGPGTENNTLNLPKKLVFNGNILEGNYGYPVWSSAAGSFLVIRENGLNIDIVSL